MRTITPGVWDHFKGGIYLVERTARSADTDEPVVVYLSLVHGTWHVRRLDQWFEIVTWPDGRARGRFVYRGPTAETPEPVFKVPR